MLGSIFAVLWAAVWTLYGVIITSKAVSGGVDSQAEWIIVCLVSLLCLCVGLGVLVLVI